MQLHPLWPFEGFVNINDGGKLLTTYHLGPTAAGAPTAPEPAAPESAAPESAAPASPVEGRAAD